MARYDKYDPVSGGYRAPLSVAINTTDVGVVKAVSLNGSGQVTIGTAGAGKGVICPTRKMAVGEVIDVMTSGEIVDFAGAAGTSYLGQTDGTVNTTAGGKAVGFTVEANRLVVRS